MEGATKKPCKADSAGTSEGGNYGVLSRWITVRSRTDARASKYGLRNYSML
jgi:hypothetical protein